MVACQGEDGVRRCSDEGGVDHMPYAGLGRCRTNVRCCSSRSSLSDADTISKTSTPSSAPWPHPGRHTSTEPALHRAAPAPDSCREPIAAARPPPPPAVQPPHDRRTRSRPSPPPLATPSRPNYDWLPRTAGPGLLGAAQKLRRLNPAYRALRWCRRTALPTLERRPAVPEQQDQPLTANGRPMRSDPGRPGSRSPARIRRSARSPRGPPSPCRPSCRCPCRRP